MKTTKLLKIATTQFLIIACVVIALTIAALSAKHLTNTHHQEAQDAGYSFTIEAKQLVALNDYNDELYFMRCQNDAGQYQEFLVHKTTHQHYNVKEGLPMTMFYKPTGETMNIDGVPVEIITAYGLIGNFFFIEAIWLISLCIVMPASTIVFLTTIIANAISQKRRAASAKEAKVCNTKHKK